MIIFLHILYHLKAHKSSYLVIYGTSVGFWERNNRPLCSATIAKQSIPPVVYS